MANKKMKLAKQDNKASGVFSPIREMSKSARSFAEQDNFIYQRGEIKKPKQVFK